MFQMGSHFPFGHLKHKLWPKKGRESNWQFDSRPLKVENRPDFLACMWRATYCWKDLNEGYNFSLDLISIRGLHAKLWGPKVIRVPILAISGLPLGSLETKSHLDVGPMGNHIVYLRGKVVASPKSGPWWVLWVWVCPWLVLAPKALKLCINCLVLVLCKFVWIVDAYDSS